MDPAPGPSTHAAADAGLVERARGGDREAFTALVDARLATTYRTALAFLSNETDARDATEEIFLRAWRDLPELREPERFAAWFGSIVDETCRTAVHGPRRAIVRDISPGTDAGATSFTLRRQIIDRVATTDQRPGLKAARITPASTDPAAPSRRARVGGIVVIALLILGLAVLIRQRLQAPETPFRTGLIAFVRDGDVYLAKPDGTEPAVIVHQDGIALATVVWSPDARRVAIDGDSGAIVFDTVTGATTYIGGIGPVWSPDGRRIAVIDATDTTRLRVQDVESGAVVTHPVDALGDLAWSPDGRWIAGSGSSRDRYSSGSNVLVKLDASSGAVQMIDPTTQVRGAVRRPAWSPDSFRIAFSRGITDDFRCGNGLLCDSDVFTADPDGTSVVQLNDPKTNADQPAWSPDGEWVAFRQIDSAKTISRGDSTEDPDANVGLVVVSPDLTATRTLDAKGVQAFAWSPEGDRLRYVRSEGQGHPATLWEVSLEDETKPARSLGLTIDPAAPYTSRAGFGAAWQSLARAAVLPAVPSPSLSAPAPVTAIATSAAAPPADPSASWPSLAIESLDGCSPPRLIATTDGSETPIGRACEVNDGDFQYAWSPTGTHHATLRGGTLSITDLDGHENANLGGLVGLTYFSWSPAGSWLSVGGSSDRILRADGSGLRELPGQPSWSPDDSRLWIGRPDGTLLVGAGDGTGLRAIGSFPSYIVWSQDGSRFAFIRDGDAWTAAADGTDQRNVTAFPLGGAGSAAWSPDGRWLAVSVTHGVWLMRPDGSDRRGLVFDPSLTIGSVIWAPDSGRLAVETYSSTPTTQDVAIYLLNADGSTAVRVDRASGPSWSPDGRYLAVSHVVPSSGGGYELGNLELMNSDGSGRHELPVTTNGNWPIWVQPDR